MNNSIEQDFRNKEPYKRLFAYKVYIYTLRQVKKENIWDLAECKDIAYDITMDAVSQLLAKEASGMYIENKYAYLMSIVKNALLNKKFIFNKIVSKNSFQLDNYSHHLRFVDEAGLSSSVGVSIQDSTPFDIAVSAVGYDFITVQDEEIIKLLNEGYDGKEIALKLNVSPSTISRAINKIRSRWRRNA